jgi:ABC-type Fe3+-siderophore transport system, permease component
MWFLEQAWLIPVIPSVGYFVILLFGKRLPLKGSELGVGTLGASFLLACDAVARTVWPSGELPVGIVTALIGGPFFLWLLVRR